MHPSRPPANRYVSPITADERMATMLLRNLRRMAKLGMGCPISEADLAGSKPSGIGSGSYEGTQAKSTGVLAERCSEASGSQSSSNNTSHTSTGGKDTMASSIRKKWPSRNR